MIGHERFFLWKNIDNYPKIILATPSYLEHCVEMKIKLSNVSLPGVVLCNFSGADLAALVREASIAALKQAISKGPSHYDVLVSKQHFETAYPKVKPSVSEKVSIMRDTRLPPLR